MRASVIIPTYNEEENIGDLLDILFGKIFQEISGWEMNVVVVDGDSTDKTKEIVQQKIEKYGSHLYLLSQNGKKGIGDAYLQGFNFAIDELQTDVVIEFDGDFQHPPQAIAFLLQKIDEGYDYVIGSRKIEGGGETEGRTFFRSLLTKFGGFIARFILFWPSKNFKAVTDPTTGLKATRVKGCLDKIDLGVRHLYSKEFGYKLQLLYEIMETGAKYTEIPFLFGNRRGGQSKMNAGTMFDVLWVCLRCRLG